MSYRNATGARLNQWGHPIDSGATIGGVDDVTSAGTRPSHKLADPWGKRGRGNSLGGRKPNGQKLMGTNYDDEAHEYVKPSRDDFGFTEHDGEPSQTQRANGARRKRRVMTRKRDGMHNQDQQYSQEAIANPGNVVADELTIAELTVILSRYGQATQSTPDQVLRQLREADSNSRLREWFYGVCLQVRATAFLQPQMLDDGSEKVGSVQDLSAMRRDVQADNFSERSPRGADGVSDSEVLQPCVPSEITESAERPEAWRSAAPRQETGPPNDSEDRMREVRPNESPGSSPSRRDRDQQSPQQPSGVVPVVSSQGAQECGVQSSGVRESVQWSRILQQALPQIQEVWRSVDNEIKSALGSSESSDLIHCLVGGGVMGDRICHKNEAPFPEKLVERFILSCCRPGGTVLDGWSGSGTVAAVAKRHRRKFIACDLRLSQCENTRTRVEGVTAGLFA